MEEEKDIFGLEKFKKEFPSAFERTKTKGADVEYGVIKEILQEEKKSKTKKDGSVILHITLGEYDLFATNPDQDSADLDFKTRLLERLKDANLIESYSVSQEKTGGDFIKQFALIKMVYSKVKRTQLLKLLEPTNGEAVKSIYFVTNKNGFQEKFVAVNEDLKEIKISLRSKYWTQLFSLAKTGYSNEISKGTADYFNSNGSNPLYKNGGYNLTKIFEKEGPYFIHAIKIEVLPSKTYKTRKNKL